MSDIGHARVPTGFAARTFATMALAPQHQFQVLTKSPGVCVACWHRRSSWTWSGPRWNGCQRTMPFRWPGPCARTCASVCRGPRE
ncbi:DUF5131 family protein [Streptomyces chiangmaiensis]|uniref:DUF5131 family protein n=1 Tax=Streptomyces chiangmaiensis TaxID=766497 RepID=A0ABU7FSJ3_9ACTN|nr:DUF5131 family protein [Streptomyces chiangmaiensis]MED7826948.1 DUF5131 family protein [Streptomyces chiangmaiensis]